MINVQCCRVFWNIVTITPESKLQSCPDTMLSHVCACVRACVCVCVCLFVCAYLDEDVNVGVGVICVVGVGVICVVAVGVGVFSVGRNSVRPNIN